MGVKTATIVLQTKGEVEIVDITTEVQNKVIESEIVNGIVVVFVPGSTVGVTTVEYEPGLLHDLPASLDRLFPRNLRYAHDETWHDGNGHSHIRATYLRQSYTIPIIDRKLILGTWQQLVLVEVDIRPRNRKIILQILGE